jgi:CheY-like chemotaxis protein/DNA-binding transcriptional ArsR family regulator
MLKRVRLLTVPALKLAGVIEKMSDSEYASYLQDVNVFIDHFPAQADMLRDAVHKKDYASLSRTLSEIFYILKKIYATDLARDSRERIVSLSDTRVNDIDHDDIEIYVENFIQQVSSLSINIQMAAHKADPNKKSGYAAGLQGKPRILAVDNAMMFLNTLQMMLENSPYELVSTVSCSEALLYLQTNTPDAFLLDIDMPEMDGYELARRIKQSGQKAPIVFITANSERKYIEKAVEVGAVGLLMKPLRASHLFEKLSELL